ncbi:unnamed protein product [Vitrella brassicaformis CCMP3155]|uniref:Uncharacterized protein n=1 Tax=Vitrella brassicaformis (strain CCMP3155) TaxID=1169540 RepID=A0A0G4EFV9_VITBC|nr:unnamed protein product [Vitrella brassicaformis CCMP3155]|eukprot:CEL95426.1 unnamed protein product [Vitrella brassicaformis CCMP3155]
MSRSRAAARVASKEEASVSPSFQQGLSQRSLKTLSSLTSVLDLHSTFVAYDYRPRYLRALSDQIHAYNLAESLILLFINLSLIAVDQFVDPSLSGLAERLGGWCLLVAIEMACEIVLFMISVRLHNLPIVRSEHEPGALAFRLVSLLCASVALLLGFLPSVLLFTLRAAKPGQYRDLTTAKLCPHSFAYSV